MRGEPLHLCSHGHQTVTYTGPVCPLCDMKTELDKLWAEVLKLRAELEALRAQA